MDKQAKENKVLYEESMEKLIDTMREILTLLENKALIDEETSEYYSKLIDQYLIFVINAKTTDQMQTSCKSFTPWSYAIRRNLSLWLRGKIDNLARPLAEPRKKPVFLALIKTGFLQMGEPHCQVIEGKQMPWSLPVGKFYDELIMGKLPAIKAKDRKKKGTAISTILTNTFLHHLLGIFIAVADKETDKKRLRFLWKTKASKAKIEIKTQSPGIMGKFSKLLKNKALGKMLEQATGGSITAKQVNELRDGLAGGDMSSLLPKLMPYLTQAMSSPEFAQMFGGQLPDLGALTKGMKK